MNAKIRQTIYALGTVITGILSIALIWGGIDAGTANNISQIIAGAITLLGGTAVTGVAASVTGKQRKDGTLDTNPVDQVLGGLQAITEATAKAADDLDKITTGITDALGQVPVVGAELGPVAQQIIDAVRKA